jgi:hypothetical protein
MTDCKSSPVSIEWSKAGGKDGNTEDGLHDPILRLKNLNNWEPLDVQKLIDNSKDEHGNLCAKSSNDKSVEYKCGIPKLGTAAFGITNMAQQDPTPGYTKGWCTMYVVQNQRDEDGIGPEYEFDIVLYDAKKKIIGSMQHKTIDAKTKSLSLTSHLPYTVEVIAKRGDNDPVVFKYSGQTWDNNDDKVHFSTLGKRKRHSYESGNREGDMGFAC